MVTGTELKVTESRELRRRVSSVLEAAKKMVVKTKKDYADAGEKLKDVKTKMQLVKDYWSPSKSKAKAVYDDIRGKEKEMLGPLTEAEGIIKAAIGAYAERMEKVREEQARVAREKAAKEAQEKHDREVEALKKEEERKRKELEKVRAEEERKRKLAEAAKEKERIAREKVEKAKEAEDAKAEEAREELARAKKKREDAQEKVRQEKAKAADLKRQAEEAKEEATKKERTAVVVDAVKEKREVPKHDGVNVQDHYGANVFDKMALIRAVAAGKADAELLIPNQSKLDALAREEKEELCIPGVKCEKRKRVAAATRKGGDA